jgi:hypothetical protein
MAQDITAPLFGHFIAGPDMVQKLNDVTATTRQVLTLARGARWVLVMIYQKAFTAGTGTGLTQYRIEMASNSAFTTDVVTVKLAQVERAAGQSVFAIGFAPLKALQFVGITRVANGTDAATYDVVVAGA